MRTHNGFIMTLKNALAKPHLSYCNDCTYSNRHQSLERATDDLRRHAIGCETKLGFLGDSTH